MSMTDLAKLDDLIVTTIDSIKGYDHAADHTESPRLASLFRLLADERRGLVANLQQQSRALGGTPSDFGSAAAAMHRRFEDLRRALGGGDTVVLEEIERGEAYLREEYDRAVPDGNVSADVRALMRRCFQVVLGAQDRTHAAKREVELAA